MILNVCCFVILVLTILWIISLIWSGKNNDIDSFGVFFILGLIFVGGFGWGVAGHISHAINISREVQAKVVVSPNSLILTTNDIPVRTLTHVTDYNKYKDCTNVTLIETGYVDIYYNTNWDGYAESVIKK